MTTDIASMSAALEAIAAELICQRKEPWPDQESRRVHFWRDKAIAGAAALREFVEKQIEADRKGRVG